MDVNLFTLVQTSLIFVVAGVLGAGLGFGYAGVCALVIALLGVKQGFPLVLISVLAHVLFMVHLQGNKLASLDTYFKPGLREMNIAAIFGVPTGMALLFLIPQEYLKYGLGVFVGITAVYIFTHPTTASDPTVARVKFQPKTKHAIAVGWLGGMSAGFASFPLAPVVGYAQSQNCKRSDLWFSQPFALVCQVVCIALYFCLHPEALSRNSSLFPQLAFAIPATLIGTKLGQMIRDHMDHKIDDAQFSRASGSLLAFCAIVLFVQPGTTARAETLDQHTSVSSSVGTENALMAKQDLHQLKVMAK